jgi:paraquat-inducible protein B
MPEIPTVPSEIQAALERAQMFVARLQSMPVDEIVENVNSITQGVDRLVNSPRLENILAGVENIVNHQEATELVPELTHTIEELGAAATELKRLGTLANEEAGPIADGAEQTLAEIRTLSGELQGLLADLRRHTGAESTLRYELGSLAREGRESLRAFRSLTDYLERHPEALLRGRAEEEGR